jgi:hypothetical protein
MDGKRILTDAIAAKRQIIDAQTTLWNMRLEALVNAGEIGSILDHLQSPVDDKIDNCGCNVQCGALQDGLAEVGNMTRAARR